MKEKEAWQQLTSKQKLDLLLAQTEWILFQAMEFGGDVDTRLLQTVIEVRKVLSGAIDKEVLLDAKARAATARDEAGGYPSVVSGGVLNRAYIAHLCHGLALDTYSEMENSFLNPTGGVAKTVYYDAKRMGPYPHHSPIAKWLVKNNVGHEEFYELY